VVTRKQIGLLNYFGGIDMSRIRIPRRKKKWHYRDKMFVLTFPYVSKYYRYVCYFNIECGIKEFHMTAEELYKSFGRYTVDDVVWWHWVRRKHLHIAPELSGEFQEYWDYFVSEGVIK
jgi:hypothetical protein